MNPRQLTGQSRSHVRLIRQAGCTLHWQVREPFLALQAAAARAGFELQVASSFRDFDRQRAIWNAKFRGERPVLDRHGQAINVRALDAAARVAALLVWSALPGASRHHWGTDLDVVEGAVVAAGYRPRLLPAEYQRGGSFHALARWLEPHMRRYGFYRPYQHAGNGVQPEPWHLSYAPVARQALRELTSARLAAAIRGQGIEGEAAILANIEAIHRRYVRNVAMPPRMRSRYATLR